jgi:hypothetical protein
MDILMQLVFTLLFAASFLMGGLGAIMLNSRRNGGIHFFRFGRFGGSFYLAKAR